MDNQKHTNMSNIKQCSFNKQQMFIQQATHITLSRSHFIFQQGHFNPKTHVKKWYNACTAIIKIIHNLISTSIDNVISSILVDNNCKPIIDRFKDWHYW
jgi:hypothetical protein